MQTFKDILGQAQALEWLRRAYQAGRLPHGLIFAGPVGVGKGTTAQVLAALFLCENPQDAQPCGRCPSCVVLAAGNHPDYHLVYRQLLRLEYKDRKAIDLSIDVIRPHLIEPAAHKSILGRGKVFVIEQADLMTAGAQNAMLKTLEEPAGPTLIILLTDQPGALLPTIQSRCQLVRFAALDDSLVCRELEKRGISPHDAADAAAFADGSLGLALKWLEDGVIVHARELRTRLESMLAGQLMTDLPDWFKNVAEEYAEKQLEHDELASKDQANREALGLYLRLAGQFLRRRLPQQTQSDSLDALCSAIEALARAELYLDSNVNISLIFQQLAVTLERLFAASAIARR
ncbi:MAG TPA: DNA polymerase III subunit delta' [Tepidisphaeraceae bacterium]|nr:DNA polymerase III subunit delta' [Tepidisphaeraceae bacterium]